MKVDMKVVGLILISVLLTSFAIAEETEISPRYYDFDAYDGFMDPGSYSNPYVVKDSYGQELGEIKPRYYDFDTNDGFMDPGTDSNPYVIDWN